jgi:hypothetical protein
VLERDDHVKYIYHESNLKPSQTNSNQSSEH